MIRHNRLNLASIALTVTCALSTARARADEPQKDDDVRERTLEKRVEELEERLKAPANRPAEAPPAPAAVAPPAPAAVAPPAPAAVVPPEGTVKSATKASVTLGGYVEAYWAWNFNNPSNFITNYRGFDNRHNIFTISNAVLDAQGTLGPVSTHVALQYGGAPNTYYLGEPVWKATNGAGPSGPSFWQNIQQANLAYIAPVGRGLTLDAGIFLSPIGPEGIAIKDQWNWSRSNLFFGLPFYHSGARATYPLTERLTLSLHIYNGWNSVVDNNIDLSPAASLTYTVTDKMTFNMLYFGGVERQPNAPEGKPWRHLFDTYLMVKPTTWLSTQVHFDGGFEKNNFGTSAWAASAAYLRVQPLPWMYLAARGDVFYERISGNGSGAASPIFWAGAPWVSSGTGTLDVRPADNLSVRLEYRHDSAGEALFFKKQVAADAAGNDIPNARSQNTVTLGATAWF
jgi:Putative beta-barrel porin-2, OmpL-like. bbp2